MGVLNEEVLVLNKLWMHIRIISVKRALKLVFADKALIVNPYDNFSVHNWESWEKQPVDENDLFIQTTRFNIRLPRVIVLTHYDKVCENNVRLTKRNIFLRDGSICQYTGQPVGKHNADVDHIIPRSRGGTNDWDNMVVCRKDINRKKGDRTPDECGLKLIKKPSKPTRTKLLINPNKKIHDSWKFFIKDLNDK